MFWYCANLYLEQLPHVTIANKTPWCQLLFRIWQMFSWSKYGVIHKSLRDFRPLRHSSRDGHAEGEQANRGRDTPSFCPTLRVLDMSTLGDAADVNPVIKFLPHTCKARVWQELGVSPLCWHAPLRRDHPGYCTAEIGNPGETYKLPCILFWRSQIKNTVWSSDLYLFLIFITGCVFCCFLSTWRLQEWYDLGIS